MRKLLHVCSKHQTKYFIRCRISKHSNVNCSSNGVHTCSNLYSDKDSPKTIKSEIQRTESKAEKISNAMKSYMERSKAHDSMLKDEIAEYEIGKRHLANIMGEDPETFTQDDINKAIQYLLPSGLFEKRARPILKHPYEIFPKIKEAQFGMDGRPHHFLYYTGKPNYYGLIHEINMKFEYIRDKETGLLMKGLMAAELGKKLSLHGYQWLEHTALEKMLIETLSPFDYNRFTILMDRLSEHPLAYREEEFILKYSRKLLSLTQDKSIIKPLVDEDGREYIQSYGKRKTSVASVTVWNKGSGKVTINGQDLSYFKYVHDRQQIMFPLQLLDKMDKVDIEASVSGGGPSGQAGAIRLGLARSLCTFLDLDSIERLRLAGLLTRDPRKRERKKPGQAGARRKYTWKKR